MSKTTTLRWCTVGLHLAEDDCYAPYYREALDHAGVPYKKQPGLTAQDLVEVDVLLLCGYGELKELQTQTILNWIAEGGIAICSGSAWGLQEQIGLGPNGTHLSREKLTQREYDRLWPEGAITLTFFGGTSYETKGSKAAIRVGERMPGIARKSHGKGMILFTAPHVGQTLCMMILGRSVEVDGIGPTDPTACLDDGLLRAEDGTPFNLSTDRELVSGCTTAVFMQPHADRVREMWIRAVIEAAENSGALLPVFWYWPFAAPAAAMLTLDGENVDEGIFEQVERMTTMFGCRPTWMISPPGFLRDVYRTLRTWEHEVGLLFKGDAHLKWSDDKIKMQYVSLSRSAALSTCLSVRPCDGQWQGWNRFYEVMENLGARVSVSKGGRQPGTSGFLFGSSHPFFPYRRDGAPHLIMEMPYSVFMPGLVTPAPVAEALWLKTLKSNGCFHIALKPVAALMEPMMDGVRQLLTLCHQAHVEFMKPEQLYAFERGRRMMKKVFRTGENSCALLLANDQELRGLTVLFVGPSLRTSVKGQPIALERVERFGTQMGQIIMTVGRRVFADIVVEADELAAAA